MGSGYFHEEREAFPIALLKELDAEKGLERCGLHVKIGVFQPNAGGLSCQRF